jgi:hypothetical protein
MGNASQPSYDTLIAPEILDDEFHAIIRWLCEHEHLKNVLEIGSSAGAGSTSALVKGLARNRHAPKLFCMELSAARFKKLSATYANRAFVNCYNVSSVPVECFATEQLVASFYNSHHTNLDQHELDQVLGWRREGIEYVLASAVPQNGIARIKRENHIDAFDLVIIDGSEFTGDAELDAVYGAKIICLDDTNSFKCYGARQRLLDDPAYETVADDQVLRNGFSVFHRKDAPSVWRDRGMRAEDFSSLWRRCSSVSRVFLYVLRAVYWRTCGLLRRA